MHALHWHHIDFVKEEAEIETRVDAYGEEGVAKTTAYDEGMIGHAEIFRNSHPNFVDRGLPGHRQPVPQIPALIERGKLRVERFHQKFNKQLANNEFVAGDRFSVADITAVTVVNFGHALEMPIPADAPNVKRWYDQMQQRESVVKSRPTHMPDGSPLPIAA